jgi:hypothetical protein
MLELADHQLDEVGYAHWLRIAALLSRLKCDEALALRTPATVGACRDSKRESAPAGWPGRKQHIRLLERFPHHSEIRQTFCTFKAALVTVFRLVC